MCKYVYIYIYTYICICICIYVCMHVYTYAHTYVCVCLSVRQSSHTYVSSASQSLCLPASMYVGRQFVSNCVQETHADTDAPRTTQPHARRTHTHARNAE